MTYLFFIASFNAFFFLVLLLQKKPKLLHDRILIYWLLYLGGLTATYAFFKDSFSAMPIFSNGIIALFLLHGPFLYLYVSSLTFDHNRFKTKNFIHFVPFLAFILYLFIASLFPVYSAGIRVDHVSENVAEPPLLFLFFLVITALSGPVYFILAQKQFKKMKESNLNFSSKDIEVDWFGKLIPIFGIIWTALIVIAVIHHVFHLFSIDFCINGLMLSLSAFIILIGYFGLKQEGVFINYNNEVLIDPTLDNRTTSFKPQLKDAELNKCYNLIDSYFIKERPYLEPDLTLPKLAENLNVPHHHLSQVINEIYGQNFFDFINKYRVEEVKAKIVDPKFQKYSILGIALESGFNSKSAFNRVFKKFTGTTPSEYRDSQQQPAG